MMNSTMRIRPCYIRVACMAQETRGRTELILEVSLLGMRFWLSKNHYSQDDKTPEMAKHSFPLEDKGVTVTILALSGCFTF